MSVASGVICASGLALASLPASTFADTLTVNYADQGSTATVNTTNDILLGALPVYNDAYSYAGFNAEDDQNPPASYGSPNFSLLTDGGFPSTDYQNEARTVAETVGSGGGGETLIYNLNSPTAISEIDFYFGWVDNGRNAACPIAIYVNPSTTVSTPGDSNWVLLSNSNSPSGFTTEAYQPGNGVLPGASPTYGADNGDFSEVSVVGSSGGSIATDVGSVEFVFGPAENNYVGLGEIGVLVPEPSSWATMLTALGATGMLTRRRSRR